MKKRIKSIKKTKKSEKEVKKKTNTTDFIKKYPGVVIAVIFSLLIIILSIWSIGIFDPSLNEKIAQATLIHQNNQTEIDSLLESLDLIGDEYETEYDKFYYNSIKEDLTWLKEKDLEIYNKSGSDLYIKQFASFIFISTLLEANEELIYDYYYFDEEEIINQAKSIMLNYNNFVIDEVDEIFNENEIEKNTFKLTIGELINEYETKKKEILNSDASQERKYVEAKKLIILSYY